MERSRSRVGAWAFVALATGCATAHPAPPAADRDGARERFGKGDGASTCPDSWWDDGEYCDFFCTWGCDDPDCADGSSATWADECAAPPTTTCSGENDWCIERGCCAGLICDGESSQCVTEASLCAGEGEECAGRACCDGLLCVGSGSFCQPVPSCGHEGESCSAQPCCGGLTCEGGSALCFDL